MPSKDNIVEVKNLRKVFRNKNSIVNAIDDVSFEIPRGKVVGLIGESGSGKTTIGRTIINLHNADGGSIKVDGKEVGSKKLNKSQKKFLYSNIQMIFQDPYSSLNGQKNIRTIIAESIYAKKQQVNLYDEFVKNRDEILKYSSNELKNFYYKNFDATELNGYKDLNKTLKNILIEIKDFKIDPTESNDNNFAKLISISTEKLEVEYYKLLNNFADLLEELKDKWDTVQKASVESGSKNIQKANEHDSKQTEANYLIRHEELTTEHKALLKQYQKAVKDKIKEILKNKVFNKELHSSLKTSRKSIIKKYSSIKNVRKQLVFEANKPHKDSKIFKIVYGIKSQKINFIQKSKITKELVNIEVYKMMERVGLDRSLAYRYPHEFSGGMRQRVGIARALISNPKVVIADEPIAALDLSIQAQIVNLLVDLKKERNLSLLFIAHDLGMIEFNSDWVLIMHLGKIVESGSTVEIFKNPVHPYTKNLMNSVPSFKKLNRGFASSLFEPEYLKEYSESNKPIKHQINKDHFVLATDIQFKQWTK